VQQLLFSVKYLSIISILAASRSSIKTQQSAREQGVHVSKRFDALPGLVISDYRVLKLDQ
jgi:hypothetical protein